MNCPKCNVPMVRRPSNFRSGFWWGCRNYPNCDITAAEHPNGTLMSYPAGKEVSKLRSKAHELMIKVFGPWEQKSSRARMYAWLAHRTAEGHIGKATEEELKKVIYLLEQEL